MCSPMYGCIAFNELYWAHNFLPELRECAVVLNIYVELSVDQGLAREPEVSINFHRLIRYSRGVYSIESFYQLSIRLNRDLMIAN